MRMQEGSVLLKKPAGLALGGEVLLDSPAGMNPHFLKGFRVLQQGIEGVDESRGVRAGDEAAVGSLADDHLEAAGPGGDDGDPGSHGLEAGKPEAFVVGHGGDEAETAEPGRQFPERKAPEKADPGLEAVVGDPRAKVALKSLIFRGGFADDDGGEIGITREDLAKGGDEFTVALVWADASENADPEFPGEAALAPGGLAVSGGKVPADIGAMGDNGIGFADEVGSGALGSGEQPIHAAIKEAGETSVWTLGNGGKEAAEVAAEEIAKKKTPDHVDIPAGVK